MIDISVLLPVYAHDNLEYLKTALESVLCQTYSAKEIVIVVGGEVSQEMQMVLDEYSLKYSFVKVVKQLGKGLPDALNLGLNHCSCEYIARMDSDDICVKDRFLLQAQCFEQNVDVSVVGGFVFEFEGDIDNIIAIRDLPLAHEDLCEYLKMRDPFHHPTVMFRKQDVLNVGGYSIEYFPEDTFLWITMFLHGFKFYNIPYNLTYMRTGYDLLKRRTGETLYKQMKEIYRFMLKNNIINKKEYHKILRIRYIASVLCPNFIKKKIYFKILRKIPSKEEIKKYSYKELNS